MNINPFSLVVFYAVGALLLGVFLLVIVRRHLQGRDYPDSWWLYGLKLVAATALYTFSSRYLLDFFAPSGVVSLFYIASGIGLSTVLIGGNRYAPSIFLGQTLSVMLGGLPLMTAMGMGAGCTLGTVAGASWLLHKTRFSLSLTSLADWLLLIVWGGCFACSINAVVGVSSLLLGGFVKPEEFFGKIITWWLGDMLGVMVIAPFALTWWQVKHFQMTAKQAAEVLLLVGLTFLVGLVVFLDWFHVYVGQIANTYWMFLLIIWVTVRLEAHWVSLIVLITSIQALQGVYSDLGIFNSDFTESKELNYWFYIIVLSSVGITLSTFITSNKQALALQAEALNRLQQIAHLVPGMVYQFRLNADGSSCFPYASSAIQDIYRVSPDEVRENADKVFSILHPDDYEQIIASIAVSAQHLTPWQLEYRVRFVDGTVRWLYGNALPQRESNGATLWHGFITDITETKEAQLAEQQRHALLNNVINSLSHPFYVINTADYTIELANKSASEWLQGKTTCYQLSHKQNTPCTELMGHPCPIVEVKRTKKPVILQHSHIGNNGEPRTMEIYAYPIFNAEGEVYQLIEYVIDITERKQVEQQLRENETRMNLSQQYGGIGSWEADLVTNKQIWSRSIYEVFGFPVITQPRWEDFLALIHPDDRQMVIDASHAHLTQGTKYDVEYRAILADGKQHWFRSAGQAQFADDGTPLRFIGIAQDITQRKQMEQQLRDNEAFTNSILNSLTAHIAVLDEQGTIITVNKAWRQFAEQNNLPPKNHCIGENYLTVCDNSYNQVNGDEAITVRQGIADVLTGVSPSFYAEYPCHSPSEQRWFYMRVSPLQNMQQGGCVISHENITSRKQAEVAVVESQKLLRTIIDTTPMRVFWKDCQLRYLGCNTLFAQDAGMETPNDLIGKDDYQMGWADQADLYRADDLAVMESGIAKLSYDEPQTTPSGDTIWLRTSKVPLKNQYDEIIGLLGIYEDITEYKQQEEILKASEARFRSIIDISPVPMALNDEGGNISFLNPAFVKTFGYDIDDILTLAEWSSKVYPDPEYRQWAADTWRATREQSEREHTPFPALERTICCKNGTFKTALISAAVIQQSFHELHLIVLYDITERKHIENALRKSEQCLKEAERIAQLGNWELDFSNNTLHWSDGIFQIFGIDQKQFSATYEAFLAAIHPDDRNAVNAAYTHSLQTQQPYNISHRLLMPDGQIKYIQEQCESYFDEHGKPLRSIGTAQDITERKLMETELRRSNAELEQFAYAVSHDMRQPLRMVTSYLSLIENKLAAQLDEETQLFLTFALEGAKRMDTMILSLLDYSRVGRRTQALSMMSSRDAVNEALAFLEPDIKASGAYVEVTGDWVELTASRDELTRLLQNLIGNALKYHEENKPPCVEVRATVTINTFRVEVHDSGIGIDPSQVDRLFKVFSRLQARTRFEGSGVGLALCRKIVEHHGGQIGVASAGEGQGSVFWFELPRLQPRKLNGE